MRVEVTFSGLIGNTSASHIHGPTATPGVGTAGVATQTPTFIGFPLGVTSGTYDHTFDTTQTSTYNAAFVTANGGTAARAEAALAASLAAGTAYLNIHTTQYPGGEIRGFLIAVPPLVDLTVNKAGSGTGRVTSDPARIDCGTDCPSQTAYFAQVTHVILTAQADPGMVFMGWNGGGCSGTDPCELTMGAEPVTVTATFFPYSATIPTLSEWGVMIFATLMAISAYWGMRRRRSC